MKSKKIIIIFILSLTLCTGCSIEYNITITKNDIIETINVTDTITPTRTSNIIMNNYNNWYPTYSDFEVDFDTPEEVSFNQKYDGVEYHEKSINEINNGYYYTYKYTYNINDYKRANTLEYSYDDVIIHKGADSLTIRTSKTNLLCDTDIFEYATVNITIDPEIYTLNNTNTSNINNNTYTWKLDTSNCDNSQILLTLNRKNKTLEQLPDNDDNSSDISKDDDTETSKNSNYIIYIFLGVILLIILIGYIWFNKMKERNNKLDD